MNSIDIFICMNRKALMYEVMRQGQKVQIGQSSVRIFPIHTPNRLAKFQSDFFQFIPKIALVWIVFVRTLSRKKSHIVNRSMSILIQMKMFLWLGVSNPLERRPQFYSKVG